jgi:tRNA dimethylallyltransferase
MLPVICLMGPTASGKTALAVELVQQLPCEIISVDSAMVYRGMDIGSAKPDAATLQLAPHQLIDICDPATPYSAGEFRRDALRAITETHARGKIPLLVGGTMLYFRVLQHGLAALPVADSAIRAQLTARALNDGWPELHAQLADVDPQAALRIHAHDSQRIQRALEVYQLTGKTITNWQRENISALANYQVLNLALMPDDRAELHARIAARFKQMLAEGFVDEVAHLYARGDLNVNLPAIRSVGYRQVWSYLTGEISSAEFPEKAIAATRQLAKRQMTWLRSWPEVQFIDSAQAAKELIRVVIGVG